MGFRFMEDEIIIGEGNKGNMAVSVFEIKGDHGISQNRTSFWIYNCILELDAIIFKNTKEGKALQKMINLKIELKEIQNFIDSVILQYVDIELLKMKIKEAKSNSFKKGMRAKEKQIRKTLGIG